MSTSNIVSQDHNFHGKSQIPCYFQVNPRIEETYTEHPNRCHSNSIKSRNNWAEYWNCVFKTQHSLAKPRFDATIKFRNPISLDDYSKFWRQLTEAFRHLAKTCETELAGFSTLEVDKGNCFHNHVLIRTTIDGVKETIVKAVAKVSSKVFGDDTAYCDYCEPIRSVDDVTAYNLGVNQKVLLFKSEFKVKLIRFFGNYLEKQDDTADSKSKSLAKTYFRVSRDEANAKFLKDHPELVKEINGNTDYALGLTDKTYDELRNDITTAFRRTFQQDRISKASDAQKREAEILVEVLHGVEYNHLLSLAIGCGSLTHVGWESGFGWESLLIDNTHAEFSPVSPDPSPLQDGGLPSPAPFSPTYPQTHSAPFNDTPDLQAIWDLVQATHNPDPVTKNQSYESELKWLMNHMNGLEGEGAERPRKSEDADPWS